MGEGHHGEEPAKEDTEGCLNSPQEVWVKVVSTGAEENHLETQ